MDNSYYTGATLIRAGISNGGGGNSNNQSRYSSYQGGGVSPSSPPLQHAGGMSVQSASSLSLQPNLLTGLPLIRNGQHLSSPHHQQPPNVGHPHGALGHSHNASHQAPPGVICCFQPIYYIPASSPSAPVYNTPPQILLPSSTNKQNMSNNNGNFGLPPGKQSHGPKRKNYKSLAPTHIKLKGVQSSPPPLTSVSGHDWDPPSPHHQSNYHHSKLTSAASFPAPISPPVKLAHQVLTRTTSSNQFFPSSSTSDSEAKQRNDKLLNFYFYDKHWRPREEDGQTWADSVTGDEGNGDERSWDVIQRSTQEGIAERSNKKNLGNGFDRQPGAGRDASPQTIIKQQKDLEVDAQIITLANGHRDLEIRLCYVTS